MTSRSIESERTVEEIEQTSRWERMTLASGIVAVAPRWLGWVGFILGTLAIVGTGTLVVRPSLFPITALGTLLFWSGYWR